LRYRQGCPKLRTRGPGTDRIQIRYLKVQYQKARRQRSGFIEVDRGAISMAVSRPQNRRVRLSHKDGKVGAVRSEGLERRWTSRWAWLDTS
jgi:hypothetical protein